MSKSDRDEHEESFGEFLKAVGIALGIIAMQEALLITAWLLLVGV